MLLAQCIRLHFGGPAFDHSLNCFIPALFQAITALCDYLKFFSHGHIKSLGELHPIAGKSQFCCILMKIIYASALI